MCSKSQISFFGHLQTNFNLGKESKIPTISIPSAMIMLGKVKNKNDDGEPVVKPQIKQVKKVVPILEGFSLFSQSGRAILKALKDINCSIDNDETSSKK